jgi:glycosyltransferase involved in cell wall biosynthesis
MEITAPAIHPTVRFSERPLLTFAVVAYKQEEYVREAVEAAFAQTYSPLQIILSDDCSPDRTFEIMQEMAAAYTGPHTICLNRNAVNKHIGGHVNEVMRLARGALMIGAAGDDISVPQRVERNFEVWDEAGRPDYCSILSGVEHFGRGLAPWYSPARTDLDEQHPVYLFDENYGFNGSGQVITTNTFRLFGDLPAGLVNEDGPIVVRNTLAGSVLFIDEPLVRHRIHDENTGSAGWGGAATPQGLLKYYHTYLVRREAVVRCVACDLQVAEQEQLVNLTHYSSEKLKRTKQLLAQERMLCIDAAKSLGEGFFGRIRVLLMILHSETTAGKFLRSSWRRLLFPSLFLWLRSHFRK